MTRMSVAGIVVAAWAVAISGQGKPAAPVPVDLDGTWKLNRELSQFPRDLGFGMDVVGGGRTTMTDPGGRGGGGSSVSPGLVGNRPASREEAENSKQLVNEVRNPPAGLTVATNAGTIVVTNEGGRARKDLSGRPRGVHGVGRGAGRDGHEMGGQPAGDPLQGRAGPRGPLHGVPQSQPAAARRPGRVARAWGPRHRRQDL